MPVYDLIAIGACNVDIFAAISDAAPSLGAGSERVVAGAVDEVLRGMASRGVEPLHVGGGGQAANVAATVVGLGGQVALVTRLGNDANAQIALSDLCGVDLTYVVRGGSTPRALVFIGEGGQRTILLDSPNEFPLPLLMPPVDAGRHVHFTSMIATADLRAQIMFRRGLPPDVTTSVDGGRLYADLGINAVEEVTVKATFVFATEEELGILYRSNAHEAEERLFDLGVRFVCRKLGPAGAALTSHDGSVLKSRPTNVKPVDTTGAGDVLAGVFLTCFLRRLPLEACLDNAVRAATISVTG
ncbi:MAG: carbohydrate kinase family protein [bacterium]